MSKRIGAFKLVKSTKSVFRNGPFSIGGRSFKACRRRSSTGRIGRIRKTEPFSGKSERLSISFPMSRDATFPAALRRKTHRFPATTKRSFSPGVIATAASFPIAACK